jgi:hypothetical protein
MSRRASAPSSAPRPPRPAGHKGKSGKHGQQIPGSDPTRRNDQGPFRPKRLVRLWLLQDRCDVRPNDAPARAYYREIAKPSVSFHQKAITSIDPTTRKVSTDQGHYQADVLAAALGADRSTSRGGTGKWSPRRRLPARRHLTAARNPQRSQGDGETLSPAPAEENHAGASSADATAATKAQELHNQVA